MSLQLRTHQLNKLLLRQQSERAILKIYYQNQVDWGEMTELDKDLRLVENKAIQKILEAVKVQKTTAIKVEQITLF